MEREFVDWLEQRLPPQSCNPLGLRDDAAALVGIHPDRCVVTSDLLAEGVHFNLAQAGPERVGRKALAVNLSDLAAMAARPVAAFVSVLLPKDNDLATAKACYEGIIAIAQEFQVAIAGGDTNVWSGPLVVSVTAVGEALDKGPLTRDGASPDDVIVVTGALGGSIESHHLDFKPRIEEALHLHDNYEVHACMDISDGLLLDLSRMAAASGCGAAIRLDDVPVSKTAIELSCCVPDPSGDALKRALCDGEDFELLLAASLDEAKRIQNDQPFGIDYTIIGEFIREQGVWRTDEAGHHLPIEVAGYEHGR